MAKKALNKSVLHKETKQLKTFKKFLPSLDLKRRQLLAEQKKCQELEAGLVNELIELERKVETELPMLSCGFVKLEDLVSIASVQVEEENLVGVELPVLRQVDVRIKEYSLLGKPHWVDFMVACLQQAVKLNVELKILQQRNELLDVAVKKITQRVNLFDKVLIPRSEQHIRKIKIVLSDAERAGVVRAKIAKAKRR